MFICKSMFISFQLSCDNWILGSINVTSILLSTMIPKSREWEKSNRDQTPQVDPLTLACWISYRYKKKRRAKSRAPRKKWKRRCAYRSVIKWSDYDQQLVEGPWWARSLCGMHSIDFIMLCSSCRRSSSRKNPRTETSNALLLVCTFLRPVLRLFRNEWLFLRVSSRTFRNFHFLPSPYFHVPQLSWSP